MASFRSTSLFARLGFFRRQKQRSWSLLVLIGVVSLFAGDFKSGRTASAQSLDDYARQQIFDFEQCANACQIELDKQLFACAPYREDKSREAPEDCFDSNYEQYERCMNYCPLDPRQQQ